jgi:hypothetical protein
MKILLLGEFSAFHKNLKEGLAELGFDAVVAGYSDGFKNIPVDISFNSNLPRYFKNIAHRIKPLTKIKSLSGFDVVQLINPFVFGMRFFPRKYFINFVIKNNHKFFLLAAGDDAYYWRYGRRMLKYGPFDDVLKYDLKRNSSRLESEAEFDFNKSVAESSNGVIPIMYDYEIGYQILEKKCLKTIPIPINTKSISYRENKPKGKISIFHGLNRYGFKGTRHVEEAFAFLKTKYPNDFELIIEGQMPLKKYLEVMERTNIVIDQLNSYSLGVNGVYALAMGKVVMGGAEPESLASLGVRESPVINLRPNAKCIIDEIEKLLFERERIETLGLQSRKFAEDIHGHIKVARQFIGAWAG